VPGVSESSDAVQWQLLVGRGLPHSHPYGVSPDVHTFYAPLLFKLPHLYPNASLDNPHASSTPHAPLLCSAPVLYMPCVLYTLCRSSIPHMDPLGLSQGLKFLHTHCIPPPSTDNAMYVPQADCFDQATPLHHMPPQAPSLTIHGTWASGH